MRADLQKKAAKEFAEYWKDKGDEKQHTQLFWTSLLRNIFGIDYPEKYLQFEDRVIAAASTQYEDVWIPSTKVMIEQKSSWKSLDEPIKQSNGTYKTAFEQAEAYACTVEYDRNPRWIICCNFKEFRIHDMNKNARERKEPVAVIMLDELDKEYFRLNFLVDQQAELLRKEMELSIEAGNIVGNLYEALIKQYKNPDNKHSQHSLNVLCVRLVFCMYAEDSGLFGRHNLFHDHLSKYRNNPRTFRNELIELFKILDTKYEDRDPYEEELNVFPYVNGGLFSDENIEIPIFDENIINTILEEGSEGFNWSEISPTIFGAVFESTLNPETRRKGGMHYTSIENIHKVIDPLFLNKLRDELHEIKQLKQYKTIEKRAIEFQNKLASITCLDPAAGSGNFLTESYISLRKLENECIKLQNKYTEQQQLGFEGDQNPIKVSIQQFYGIEINDFACTVAKTALWIAEHQMMKKTAEIVHTDLDFLPLKSYVNMVCGNALRMDWNDVVDKKELSYIMGNPPFLGYSNQNKEQKNDILFVYKDEYGNPYKTAGKNDYVSGWYFKSASYIEKTKIKCAFVSTNSITQGEQVANVWKPLYKRFNICINFAWKSFKWKSESQKAASVFCVIIGFSWINEMKKKKIFDDYNINLVDEINPYLIEYKPIFLESRKKSICNVPQMITGNRPADGGHLIIEESDYEEFIIKEPNAQKYIKKLTGANEFVNGIKRYCLWLVGVSPNELKGMPLVMKRVDECRKSRLSGAPDRQKLAATPTLFRETRNPDNFIIVPNTTSSNRLYIPIGFLDSDTIATNAATIIPNASKYHYGVLQSNIHMIWTKIVCGRLGDGFRYSKDIVYNNFPWCNATEEQKLKIKQTAQTILDARALYPDSSLADLYDPLLMPIELRKAHEANDKAVMKAYGFKPSMTEDEIVAELFKLYQKKIEEMEKK